MTENDAVFRQSNEKVQDGIEELAKLANEHGQPEFSPKADLTLQFYCECSDENCRQRIELSVSTYGDIHQNRSRFVVLPGHEVIEVESVIETNDAYTIVEKFLDPPEDPTTLMKHQSIMWKAQCNFL